MNEHTHRSVLLQEAINGLNIEKSSTSNWYIDATLGGGGHTEAMLKLGANVLAFDWDAEAIKTAQSRFASEIESGKLVLSHEAFSKLIDTAKQISERPMGILFDFGTSTMQLLSSQRGFSFEGDGMLDMRMDTRMGVTAADLLGFLSERELTALLQEYGGEEYAKKIAQVVKRAGAVTTAKQLADLVKSVKPRKSGIHPATKTFQALRIAVNQELDEIREVLPQALSLLKPGGRLVTIAFHEGEDRLVKQFMREQAQAGQLRLITQKPIIPSPEELERNPRSRSAKLRIAEKT